LAENAVDNGVELRIRRQVTAIDAAHKKNGLELTVRHWEPKDYVAVTSKKPIDTIAQLGSYGGMAAVAASFFATTYLPLAIGIVLAFQLLRLFYGNDQVSPSTPLKDLVKKAGLVFGTGGTKVSVEDMKVGGSGSAHIMNGVTVAEEKVRANFVINCAGSASDQIAQMIGDSSFKIKPRLGDYLLLNRNQGHLAKHTLFPCPDPVLGKGVLVQTTLWGNLILGPTARDMHKTNVADMAPAQIQHYILSKCQGLVPTFDPKEIIHAFCGARAKSDRGDWIIENSASDGRMIHVAGIDSPGLAGSPAIAVEVVRLLEESGCPLAKNSNFNPRRAPIITPKAGMRGLKMGPVGKNDSDGTDEAQMAANVICKYVFIIWLMWKVRFSGIHFGVCLTIYFYHFFRCEKVTELEVVRALRRSLPIDSTQAIRKRTRAGMGHCQGDPENYNCEARVKAIIARECGVPVDQVGGRPWPATSTLTQRWPDEAEKKEMAERMKTK
jgi:glycerol-3-phosphate dehydrogenase